jgi:short-subunit dehydrogenase
MRKRGSGRIVNVSSTGGRMTFPLMGAYNATKYAVESLSDALRNEVHRFGIRVALIEPGYIRTEFADVALGTTNRYDVPDSPYASMFKATGKGLKAFEATGVGPIHTSKAIERAINSRNPLARYVTPWRTYVGLAIFKLLPTRVMDYLMRAFLGANKSA